MAETIPAVTEWSKPSGTADGQHPVAVIELVRIPPLGLDAQLSLDLEHGEVRFGVETDYPRPHVVAGPEPHQDLIGVLDNVVDW